MGYALELPLLAASRASPTWEDPSSTRERVSGRRSSRWSYTTRTGTRCGHGGSGRSTAVAVGVLLHRRRGTGGHAWSAECRLFSGRANAAGARTTAGARAAGKHRPGRNGQKPGRSARRPDRSRSAPEARRSRRRGDLGDVLGGVGGVGGEHQSLRGWGWGIAAQPQRGRRGPAGAAGVPAGPCRCDRCTPTGGRRRRPARGLTGTARPGSSPRPPGGCADLRAVPRPRPRRSAGDPRDPRTRPGHPEPHPPSWVGGAAPSPPCREPARCGRSPGRGDQSRWPTGLRQATSGAKCAAPPAGHPGAPEVGPTAGGVARAHTGAGREDRREVGRCLSGPRSGPDLPAVPRCGVRRQGTAADGRWGAAHGKAGGCRRSPAPLGGWGLLPR